MDVCVVGGWESGEELEGSLLMLMNVWICFRTSISFEGNNPPLQIRSFGGNRGKCNRTRDSTEPLFSAVLMRQELLVADSSYLPWNEAYEHSLSLSSHLFLVLCYEDEPNERHFFAEIFIKRWFCSKKSCRICCMLAKYGLKFMISHAQSLDFEFHIQVDFGFNDIFSHIFSFLYHNSVETSWFSLMRHEKLLTEEKCMQSSIDTTISMLSPTNSPQSAFARKKKRGFNAF